jgi:tetratricopeptide (TPR) repeat protein
MTKLKNMKRNILASILLTFIISLPGISQDKPDNSKIDIMLIRGDFKKIIDTCDQILSSDSLNSEIYYKKGLAYQSLLSDDKSLECFIKAAAISPDNNNYNFTLAKSFYNKGKLDRAKPLLLKICASDSTNWPYAFYLTSIYMQEGKYDESIKIYYRFYKQDYYNYTLADKIGFAYLKKEELENAKSMFNRSLSLNPKNLNAIKNLAYIYAGTTSADTALKLLTKGISIDSTDMDLYARRAAINFTIFNYIKAKDDYLKLISSGDSSVLNLKRAGLGFAINHQPKQAIRFFLLAYYKDTADIEVSGNLAQNYNLINDLKSSAYYYRNVIKMLTPASAQLGLNYLLLAEILKSDKQYSEAVSAYLKSQEFRSDNNVIMIIANLYDEKLKDIPKAIRYYELYLNKIKNSKDKYDSDYTESVTKRIESLKEMNQPAKHTYSIKKPD